MRTKLAAAAVMFAIAGCGGAGQGGSGQSTQGRSAPAGSSVPLTLAQVRANLLKAGYRTTVYTPNEGVLEIDATHKATAGISIDYSPRGQKLYAAVYEASDPAVRAAVIAHNSDEAAPVVRGDLIFTISGTEPELQTIVKDAGDAGPSAPQTGPGSSADAAAIKAAVQRFIDVYAAGDEKSVCASFTPQVLAQSKTFCDPKSIFYKRKPDPRVKQYAITSVTTNGDTATATVSFQGITEELELRKPSGQWKIDTKLGAGQLF
jgi:hypothetical protein